MIAARHYLISEAAEKMLRRVEIFDTIAKANLAHILAGHLPKGSPNLAGNYTAYTYHEDGKYYVVTITRLDASQIPFLMKQVKTDGIALIDRRRPLD